MELIPSAYISVSCSWVPRKELSLGTFQRRLLFLFTHLRTMHVTETSEKQSQTEQPETTTPRNRAGNRSWRSRCSLLE